MNYIETCTKIAVYLWRSSNYRPLTSVLHVRPGWIIYQNMRETWEKKVMKFEREIPIGLDARRKKWQGGGAIKAPPPMGLGLIVQWNLVITRSLGLLYQVSHYIRVKNKEVLSIKSWDQQNNLVIRGFCYIRPLYNEVPLYRYTESHTGLLSTGINYKVLFNTKCIIF